MTACCLSGTSGLLEALGNTCVTVPFSSASLARQGCWIHGFIFELSAAKMSAAFSHFADTVDAFFPFFLRWPLQHTTDQDIVHLSSALAHEGQEVVTLRPKRPVRWVGIQLQAGFHQLQVAIAGEGDQGAALKVRN